ncbi:MAG: UDP-N-acetylmuramate--L-alanine ligase [Candidatus Omnitrophica bacterium]|nr:UDP-N-acetylmuramate--L-alanine ligase [Candidatus Omnitrophota bacterium]
MRTIFEDLIGNTRRVYLIGIGGAGMSALARILKHRGIEVAGSDRVENRVTRELAASGITVHLGQNETHFQSGDLVIYSSAIKKEHLELKAAVEAHMKVCHRAEILASLFNRSSTSIAVTGTHGKTTTTSMIAFVLSELGKNPTCMVGGDLLNLGTNTLCGDPQLWVAEVDESDQTHELFAPHYGIVTNLEEDHMEHYGDLEALKASFTTFISHFRNPGLVIYSSEDQALQELVRQSAKPALSFGWNEAADFSARAVEQTAYTSKFELWEAGLFVTDVRLSVPGRHNIANALAAFALLFQLGLEASEIVPVLERFRGARRRLEIKWSSPQISVIDDYAHHPTEVKASLEALRSLGEPLTVIFQPHRYSRTLHLYREFGHAFDAADQVILTEIYSAGEANPGNVDVNLIYRQVRESGFKDVQMMEKDKIISNLLSRTNLRGVVAFLGAGDIGEIADEFANCVKNPA